MKFHRNAIWLVPLLLLVTFPLWSIPVGDFLTPRGGFDEELRTGKSPTRHFNMDRVKILQNQKGKKTALIRAAKAQTGKTEDILLMDNVDADIFDEDGNITNIVARHGKYNTITKILTLIDDVVVHKTEDNQFLYSDLLYYDEEKRTVSSPGKTRLKGDDVEIKGGSLDYDIPTRSYVIDNRVHCILNGFAEP
ncbi:MAG: LPS export ABC transporter periplasmic protein LptC [Desulforhopalus sp.]